MIFIQHSWTEKNTEELKKDKDKCLGLLEWFE